MKTHKTKLEKFRLPTDLADDLQRLATASGMTKTEIVTLAMRQAMKTSVPHALATRTAAVQELFPSAQAAQAGFEKSISRELEAAAVQAHLAERKAEPLQGWPVASLLKEEKARLAERKAEARPPKSGIVIPRSHPIAEEPEGPPSVWRARREVIKSKAVIADVDQRLTRHVQNLPRFQ